MIDQKLKTKTALLSVYDKQGIVEFAKELVNLGFEIIASGGTAKILSSAGIKAADVADLIGGGAILGHRVVTLSREIYAGLLSRDVKEDRDELERLKIPRIDLVCVDLYPLAEEIARWKNQRPLSPETSSGHSPLARGEQRGLEAILEKTDIGGPTLLRAAAKGRRIVICDPADRPQIIKWLKDGEPDKDRFLSELAAKAEFAVANYALESARYHSAGKMDGLIGREILECKYGENAWQTPAGLFAADADDTLSLSKFQVVAGTEPSYNNLCDIDRLLQTITHIAAGYAMNRIDPSKLNEPSSVPTSRDTFSQGEKGKLNIALGVKHGNPCGAATSDDAKSAIKKMLEGDLRAIFGGVVMVNFEIDEELAEVLLTHRMENNQHRLLDGIAAPAFTKEALEMLRRKGDKCRFLVNSALLSLSEKSLDTHLRFRYVRVGFLRQPNYDFVLDLASPKIETSGRLSADQKKDILLAWAIGSTSNSNTITLVKDQMLLGNGVGQQDRVGGCELAIKRAKDSRHKIKNAVAYSDSFFPFVDGLQVLQKEGISAILATSGSVRDVEVKKFCIDHKITLIMLPDKEARGFFGH